MRSAEKIKVNVIKMKCLRSLVQSVTNGYNYLGMKRCVEELE